ncbi:F0F1 ATP synthase subunit B [Protofrankia symbiont of Coriaria ruscifolia]|uniref:ATP synthase subunit b n=1 Tax=Candidatus Protofrankia californiensis TaxID=1839754 RepID=A0A1C3PET9_9ACTN|nr:F0F1 ATP synthase subunit B [Protofrankia symbiont of Coriaria ruscifolia]SBW28324.1 ATP synthase subunit b [Candidatus Protofrankia californiensis]
MVIETLLLAAEEGGHSDENVLVPPLGELLIGTLSFGLLVAFFFWKVYPQIRRTYAERSDRIEGDLARAERTQREAQELLGSYRRQLAEAQDEAGRIRQDAREQGQQILDALRAQAGDEVAEIKARGETQLAAERAQVVAQIRREIGEIALELATKIVNHELQRDDRQRQLVDDFIAGLEHPDGTVVAAPAGPGG